MSIDSRRYIAIVCKETFYFIYISITFIYLIASADLD